MNSSFIYSFHFFLACFSVFPFWPSALISLNEVPVDVGGPALIRRQVLEASASVKTFGAPMYSI